MPRIRLKHSRKGHGNPHDFEHTHCARIDAESVLISIMRSGPPPAVQQIPSPAFGDYRILDMERDRRQSANSKDSFLPWPTIPERGLYSRPMMESDLEAISLYEASITQAIANGTSGLNSIHAYAVCEKMRENCKKALMRTVSILQAKDAEDKQKTGSILTQNNIGLTPQMQEHVRRLSTDRAYLMRCLERSKTQS